MFSFISLLRCVAGLGFGLRKAKINYEFLSSCGVDFVGKHLHITFFRSYHLESRVKKMHKKTPKSDRNRWTRIVSTGRQPALIPPYQQQGENISIWLDCVSYDILCRQMFSLLNFQQQDTQRKIMSYKNKYCVFIPNSNLQKCHSGEIKKDEIICWMDDAISKLDWMGPLSCFSTLHIWYCTIQQTACVAT